MELKYKNASGGSIPFDSFQSYLYGIEMMIFLYILECHSSFQSYLYGIEMRVFVYLKPDGVGFQSYLYGIEMTEEDTFLTLSAVSIVPLWN